MKQLEAICKAAQGELGIKEDPPDSNCVKYNTWYYGRAVSGGEYAWCMVFMQWLANKIGLSVYRTASCSALATWAKQQKQWVTQDFQKGDWVEFDFSGKRKVTQHVGLVVGLYPGGVITIEGNTGSGNDANGGQVQQRKRALRLITGAWRPPYQDTGKEDTDMTRYHCVNDIPEAFREPILLLVELGILTGYGNAGNDPQNLVVDLSHDMVRMFVCNYRAGAYDGALLAAGKEPAILPK